MLMQRQFSFTLLSNNNEWLLVAIKSHIFLLIRAIWTFYIYIYISLEIYMQRNKYYDHMNVGKMQTNSPIVLVTHSRMQHIIISIIIYHFLPSAECLCSFYANLYYCLVSLIWFDLQVVARISFHIWLKNIPCFIETGLTTRKRK